MNFELGLATLDVLEVPKKDTRVYSRYLFYRKTSTNSTNPFTSNTTVLTYTTLVLKALYQPLHDLQRQDNVANEENSPLKIIIPLFNLNRL